MTYRALAAAAASAVLLSVVVLIADRGIDASASARPAPGPAPALDAVDPASSTARLRSGTGGPVTRIPDLFRPDAGDDADTTDEAETPEEQDRPTEAADDDSAAAAPPARRAPLAEVVGRVLWGSDFEDGLDSWRYVHDTGDADVVDSPVREGGQAVRLTAAPGGDGGNGRSQLDGPVIFEEGDEAFVGWSTYFPDDMPAISPDGFFLFFQFHGAPFDGSPPLAFDVSGDRIGMARGEDYGFDVPWSMPLQKGRWIDFVVHLGFSQNDGDGFIELWVDGAPQRFADGSTRMRSATILGNQDEGLFPIATNYFGNGATDETVTLYHDAIRVADTFDAASPRG